DLVRGHRLVLAAYLDRGQRCVANGTFRESVHSLADQNVFDARQLFQTRGDIHDVAHDGERTELAAADSAREYFAGIDADAHLERDAGASPQAFAEAGEHLLHSDRGSYGTLRIVVVSMRRAEQDHHGVAHVFVDETP